MVDLDNWESWVEGVFSTNTRDESVRVIGERLSSLDNTDLVERINKAITLAEKLEKGNSLTSMREETAWGLAARVLRDLRDGKEVEW